MKILVTGAAGFLGSQIARAARERGHEVRCFVRKTSNLARLNDFSDSLCYGDMTDSASLSEATDGIDAVVHCAATTSEGAPDLELSRKVNVEGTRALLAAFAGADAPARWIQISSMSAHPDIPSVYGRTKLEADEVVRQSQSKWTILKPSLIYGPGGTGLVDKTLNFMRKLPIMPVVGPGTELIRPVYVTDVAVAALDCIENAGTVGKTYMLGGADEITLNDFFARLGAKAGLRRPMFHLPIPLAYLIATALGLVSKNPPLTVDNVIGVKKAQRVYIDDAVQDFGYKPIAFDEGLDKTFAAQSE